MVTTRRLLRRRTALVVAAAAGLAALTPAPTLAAVATTAGDDELWYYDVPGFADLHAQGITGKGITVAVLDGPINPDAPDLSGTDLVAHEDSTCPTEEGGYLPGTTATTDAVHGTSMAAVIGGSGDATGIPGVAPDATVLHYAVMVGDPETGDEDICEDTTSTAEGMDRAVADGAQILSMSIGGPPLREVEDALVRALRAGVIVVASGAHGYGADGGYPGLFNGVVSVEGSDREGNLREGSGVEPDVVAPGIGIRAVTPGDDGSWTTYRPSTGSSPATAWVAGALALVWSQHPDATGNQIIQTLVRHTAGRDGDLGEPEVETGHGYVSVTGMLSADPTSYPDENPLLVAGDERGPDRDTVLGSEPAETASEEPAPSPEGSEAPEEPVAEDSDDASAGLPVAALAGLGVLALLAIGAVVLLRSRRTAPASAPTHAPAPPAADHLERNDDERL